MPIKKEITPEEVSQLKYLLWKFASLQSIEFRQTLEPLNNFIREHERKNGAYCRDCKRVFQFDEIDPCDIPF